MARCEEALARLLRYCRAEGWAGYDPYDGLNSPLARLIPDGGKTPRIVLTQVLRRSPVNFRSLLGIKKDLNPKGLALAARGFLSLKKRTSPFTLGTGSDFSANSLDRDFRFIVGSLWSSRSPAYEEACWGYNFPWQSRTLFAPRGLPNAVCTVFAALCYLDWYDQTREDHRLTVARSSGRFILDYLNRTIDGNTHCFSYTPLDNARVHNVNMLAAELLARTYTHSGEAEYKEAAEKAVLYTLARQRDDGSWPYGDDRNQRWIDGFHTGFILISLSRLTKYLGETRWISNLERGYAFYRDRFFLAEGAPRYYHNKVFPFDAHSAAVGVLTFLEMADHANDAVRMADKVMKWALDRLQDPKGFFYYQIRRFHKVRIPYMRWSQTWMMYAMSEYLARPEVLHNG